MRSLGKGARKVAWPLANLDASARLERLAINSNGSLGGTDEFTDRLGIYSLTPSSQLPSGISMTTTWVPWYDILLFFLRVGLTKIWELGTDPIAIRGSAVLEGPV
jgi:hypothetical protein